MKSTKHTDQGQKGASLIEVLVSVFIFTIGVLGFASLQSRSVQATFDNGQRDQVVWITQSMVDRLRLNAGAATTYTSLLTDFDIADCATPTTLCDAAACTAAQMASFDVWDLYCRNTFQGTSAVKGLSANLSCTDADSDGNCDTAADLTLTNSWCARSIESTQGLSTAAEDVCDNTLAQMSYRVGFRP